MTTRVAIGIERKTGAGWGVVEVVNTDAVTDNAEWQKVRVGRRVLDVRTTDGDDGGYATVETSEGHVLKGYVRLLAEEARGSSLMGFLRLGKDLRISTEVITTK